MPSRIDIPEVCAVEAVVRQLQSALALTEASCYPVARAQDVPILPPGGAFFLTVAPGGGSFIEEEQVTGVPATNTTPAIPSNATEEMELIVSGYTRIKTDQTSHDRYMLFADSKGLLNIKRKILGALVDQDLTDEDGNTFLRQWLYARHADPPDIATIGRDGINCGVIRVTFGLTFDWQLP